MWSCARRCCCWFYVCRHDVRCWASKKTPFYIECWNIFSRFFFSSHSRCHPVPLPVLSQKKETHRQKYAENERTRKIMPYIASPIWINHHTSIFSLSLSPFVVAIVNIVKYVKVKLRRTYLKMNIKKRFLLLLPRCTYVLSSNYYIELKDVASCWFWVHRQRTNEEKHPDQ